MAAAFPDRQPNLHVIDATELGSIVNGASTALALDVPLVVYDPHDPADARELVGTSSPSASWS